MAPSMPRMMAAATSVQPSSSNIIAPERMTLQALILSCPAYFVALRRGIGQRPDAARAAGADVRAVVFRQYPDGGVCLPAARLKLDARIDFLVILAEDHHTELARLLHGRRHAFEVAHGPDEGVEVE